MEDSSKNCSGYIELRGRLENIKEVATRHEDNIRDLSTKEIQDIRDITASLTKINEEMRNISEKVVKQSNLVNLIEIMNSSISQLNVKIASIPDIQREVAVMNNRLDNALDNAIKLDELNKEVRQSIDAINKEIKKCSEDFDDELKAALSSFSDKLSKFDGKFTAFYSKEYVELITKITDMDSERKFLKFIFPFCITLLSALISLFMSYISVKFKS